MQGVVLIDGAAHVLAFARRARDLYVTAEGVEIRLLDGQVRVDGEAHQIETQRVGDRIWVHYKGETHELIWRSAVAHLERASADASDQIVRAPMPGAIVSVLVAAGQHVEKDEPLIVIESMKLESTLRAPMSGVVAEVKFAQGAAFDRNAVLVTLAELA